MISREGNDGIAYHVCAVEISVSGCLCLDQRRSLLFLVVQFVSPALGWCGGRAFYKLGPMSRAPFASFGNGYARLKRCADGLSKILPLLESPCGEFDRALARGRVSELESLTARGQAGRLKVPDRARAPVRRRISNLRLSPSWNAPAGPFFKCGDLLQAVTDVPIVILTVGAIFAPHVIVFVRV
jgi:hypothetical protein